MSDQTTDWQVEAVRLRRDQQMATAEIAERFGKSASQVRKVIAQASAERHVNAVGNPAGDGSAVPGQMTVDEYLTGVEPDPIDEFTQTCEHGKPLDVDCEGCREEREVEAAWADPLDDFRAEAGEAVGPMPPDPSPPEPGQYEVRLAGTRQMALDFGENASLPTGATIVLKSEKRASGFYGLGDVFSGTFTARVTKTPGEEKFDKDMGEYMAKDIAYQATITEFTIDVSPSG